MKQPLRVTPIFLFFVVLILPFVSAQQHSYASAHATAQASAQASALASAHSEATAGGTSSAYGGMSRGRGIYDYNGYQANALALARSGAQFGGRFYPHGYRQMEDGALVGDRYEMNGEPFSNTVQNMNGIIPYDTGNHATSSASAASAANAENAASSANAASASSANSEASASAKSFASSGGRMRENPNMFSRNVEQMTGGIYPGFQRNGGVFAGSYNWGGMQNGREFQTHTHSGFHRFSPHDEILMHREMSSAGGLAGGKISSVKVTRVGEGMPLVEGMQTGRVITTTKLVRANGDASSEKGLETVEVTKKLTNNRISSKDGMLLTERETGLEALRKLIDSLSSRRQTNSSLLLADRHTLEKENKPVVLKRTTTITTNITLQSRSGHSKPGALHVIENKHTNKTEELVNKAKEEEVPTENTE